MLTKIDKFRLTRVLKEREEYLKRQAAEDLARNTRADVATLVDRYSPPGLSVKKSLRVVR